MSETEKTKITTPFMSETEIAAKSVKALSNRPNEHSGQYGRKGLTPEELKAAFSALPEAIAAKMNELLPRILARFDETENAFKDADEDLRAAITEAIAAAEGKLDRLEKPVPDSYAYVYAVSETGEETLIRAADASLSSSVVRRDASGRFKAGSPSALGDVANKLYVDSEINAINNAINDVTRDLQNLGYAASGNIYKTVALEGSGTAFQVENACPYGILTRLGGNVAKIKVALPFDLNASVTITPTSLNSFETVQDRSVYIRCSVPEGATVSVGCDSEDPVSTDSQTFGLSSIAGGSGFDNGVGTYGYFPPDTAVTATQDNMYVYILPVAKTYRNLRIMLSNYETAATYGTVAEIEIPEAIRSLVGYGQEGAYIDFANRRYYSPSGTAYDISAYLPEEFDVISLLPSAIVKFTDESGNAVTASYSFTYKNKITI